MFLQELNISAMPESAKSYGLSIRIEEVEIEDGISEARKQGKLGIYHVKEHRNGSFSMIPRKEKDPNATMEHILDATDIFPKHNIIPAGKSYLDGKSVVQPFEV